MTSQDYDDIVQIVRAESERIGRMRAALGIATALTLATTTIASAATHCPPRPCVKGADGKTHCPARCER